MDNSFDIMDEDQLVALKEEIKTQNQKSKEILQKEKDVKHWDEQTYENNSYVKNVFITKYDLRHDCAKLGSKKLWKPNEQQKENNRRIDRAKKLTKKATADTLTIYDIISRKQRKGRDITSANNDQNFDAAFKLFSSQSFTAKMFTSSYIKGHYSECYDLVAAYHKMYPLHEIGEEGEANYELLKRIDPIMSLFTKRFEHFNSLNRININSKAIVMGKDDEDLPEMTKITDEDYRKWLILTNDEKAARKEKRKDEALKKSALAVEELEQIKDHPGLSEEEKQQDMPEVKDLYELSKDERIRALPKIRFLMEQRREEFQDPETAEDRKSVLRRELMELNALKKLAELEVEYSLKTVADSELTDKLYAASEEVRKLLKRMNRPADIVSERTMPKRLQKMTRSEALSNESDRRSFSERTNLLKLAEALSKGWEGEKPQYVEKIQKAARVYFDDNFYIVAEMKEVKNLKKLQQALAEVPKEDIEKHAGLKALVDKVQSLTMGGLVIPEEHKGAVRKELGYPTDEVYDGNFAPETSVVIRDGALNMFRKMVDRRNDPLFAHEPTVNDLRQGKISNCWMVAATTCLVNLDPQIIKNAMKDNGDGTVTVRLYRYRDKDEHGKKAMGAEPVYITVTKEVPRLVTGGAIQSSGALWMQMLEKARAFLGDTTSNGETMSRGYRTLWYSDSAQWIFALTGKRKHDIFYQEGKGGEMRNLPKTKEEKDRVFNKIFHARENKIVFSCGTKEKNIAAGLNAGHAYTILGAEIIDGEQYVIMRNPYSNMSLEYKKNGSNYMTESYLSSEMNYTCGQFRMKFEDLLSSMSGLSYTDLTEESVLYEPRQVDKQHNINKNADNRDVKEKKAKNILDEYDVIEEDVEDKKEKKKEEKNILDEYDVI
ncbi:MAG: hypothetical protein IKO61_09595 [Lachnospiraceae bacterium]|nr:hypothetical protein [Lachnospiraceae bacterium]